MTIRLCLPLVLSALLFAHAALAAETAPGDACGADPLVTNVWQMAGGKENGGIVNGMFCNGTAWQGIINFQSSGNVGIGTTAPGAILDVRQTSYYNPIANFQSSTYGSVNITATGAPSWLQMNVAGAYGYIIALNSSSGALDFKPGTNINNGANISFSQNGTANFGNAVVSGNMGIGTATPAAPLHVNGEEIVGMNALACSSTTAGAIRYNSSLASLEFCNGTAWGGLPAAATSCSAPSGLSFTNLTSQSLGVTVTSNTATITFTGCSGSYSVAVAGAATAQISINGGAWTTSGVISSGQTLRVRMTTSGSASTTLTATVTVNATSTNWTTTTRGGSLNMFITAAAYIGGSLGGLTGADALCQSEAGTAGYAGTYKAVLSDDSTNAKDRLTLSYPIVRASDGVTVSTVNLWNGALSNSFGYGAGVWTGSQPAGTIYATGTCGSWASTGANGIYGIGNRSDSNWMQASASGCGGALPLYCIQQ